MAAFLPVFYFRIIYYIYEVMTLHYFFVKTEQLR